MGHYAKVVNGIVQTVIVADEDFFKTFVDTSPGTWVKTSYNTRAGIYYDPATGEPAADQSKSLRKNYAGIGYTYDAVMDAFIPPKPYSKWILNEDTCVWDSPVPRPDDGKSYYWDDDAGKWVLITTGSGE